ncbi:MAG TPA: ABC transporter permease [Devosia sp.]|nr:ABC transporter permease [Devosia sp.]
MNLFLAHTSLHLKRLLRTPAFWTPTILFPMMLYSFFGASLPPAGIYSQMAVGSFAVYAVLGIAFYQLGASNAQDREQPFATWQHTLPGATLPAAMAQMVAAVAFTLVAVLLVLAASFLFGKTPLDLEQSLRLLAICALIAVPASLMGIALSFAASAKAAPALANLIFLPLAFLGGLWIPPSQMPAAVRNISIWTPTRQMGEFAWNAIANTVPDTRYLIGLAAYTLAFGALAWALARRDRQKRFG